MDAALYLMRLSLMALGGYEAQLHQREASAQMPSKKLLFSQDKKDKTSTPQKVAGADTATFPLPPHSVDRAGRNSSDIPKGPKPDKHSSSTDKTAHNTESHADEKEVNSIVVRCVYLARAEEVELLWVETCKVFASLCGSTSVPVANRALYCLQVKTNSC